jgi:hypothetical protein
VRDGKEVTLPRKTTGTRGINPKGNGFCIDNRGGRGSSSRGTFFHGRV